MGNFKKILSIYSLIVSTALVVVAPLFLPRTTGLTILAVFVPFALYFWIRETDPKSTSVGKWSLRLVTVIALFSALGVFAFWLKMRPTCEKKVVINPIEQTSPEASSSGSISLGPKDDLAQIRSDLAEIKAILNVKSTTLGIETDSPTSTKSIIISSADVDSLDVYEDKSITSEVVGEIKYGNSYPVVQKESGWYLIFLDETTQGWVKDEFVKEI